MEKESKNQRWARKLSELGNNEYIPKGEYTNNKAKTLIEHTICKTEFMVRPNSFISNDVRCPNPSCKEDRKIKYLDEQWKYEINKISNGQYEALGDFKNKNYDILIKHKKCGNEFYLSPYDFRVKKKRCPFCKKRVNKHTKKSLSERIKEELGEEYIFDSNELKTVHDKISIYHNICKTSYKVMPRHILYDHNKCPTCAKLKQSGPEKYIMELLEAKNLQYKKEYQFNDNDEIFKYKFDFAVFKNNDVYIIEYDGEYHFKLKTHSGKKGLEETIYNDYIKNQFCLKNNIKLLRIPYWEKENIEELIEEFID